MYPGATKVVELVFWWSPYHFRNSLKITGCPRVSDKIGPKVDGYEGEFWTTTLDLGRRSCKA